MKPEFLRRVCWHLLFVCITASYAQAQTSAFTYQGKLNEGGIPANSTYEMQFKLFDASDGGDQIGTTQTITNVQTNAGIFTVQLDFGTAAFSGAERWIEIGISPAGQNNFTTLAPRQKLTSAPYSIQSLNAVDSANLGGIPAGQYVQTSDLRLSDARVPLPGSNDYVQNSTVPQATVNFSIGGIGRADIFDATTQFNISGNRVLSVAGSGNIFAGSGAGMSNTSGFNNSFVGNAAGLANTTGRDNAFFGTSAGAANNGSSNAFFGPQAGMSNTAGNNNSFFGREAGALNTTGFNNAFLGRDAGAANTTGSDNTFVGGSAGRSNTTASFNTFVGLSAGGLTTNGASNTFVGNNAGLGNSVGSNNAFFGKNTGLQHTNGNNVTLIGTNANVGTDSLNFATAIGSGAIVGTSDMIVLGKTSGTYNGVMRPADAVVIRGDLGIGTITPPATKLHVNGASEGIRIQGSAVGDANGAYLSFSEGGGKQLGYVGDGSGGNNDMYLTSYVGNVHLYTPIGAALTATSTGNVSMRGGPALPLIAAAAQVFDNNNGPFKGLVARGIFMDASPGNGFDTFLRSPVQVCARTEALGSGFGGYALVRCTTSFSSVNNKNEVQPFRGGLDIIRQLKPVSFRWKENGSADLGLNAEDVAQIEPLLVNSSKNGEVEDVREGGLQVVLVNAIKELEAQIRKQQQEIEALKRRQQGFDALKKQICQANPEMTSCLEEQK